MLFFLFFINVFLFRYKNKENQNTFFELPLNLSELPPDLSGGFKMTKILAHG